MQEQKKISPPAWAGRLLAWYCKPALLEDLQGDLHEYFERNVKLKGLRRARLIYVLDVFKFFRFYTVQKPEFLNLLIHWIMLGSYIKTSGRSIVRNKLFSTINILGLAVSMSVGLLLIGMLSDLFSYDTFHKNYNRIYRVTSLYEFNGHRDEDWMATTSGKAAKAIKDSFTGIEEVAILRREFSGDITFNEKTIPLSGLWADDAFLKVFSFPLLQGNPVTALKAPFSVVLTEESARKLFDDVNVLGKTIVLNKDKEYTITGIVKDVPHFSHMKFQMLGSYSTREVTERDNKREMSWDNVWNTYAYVLLPPTGDRKIIQKNLDNLSAEEDKTVKNTRIQLGLQPLEEIMTGENLNNQIGQTMGRTTVWILGGLAFIVILSACLNYTNLSIARSMRRAREVGIRKTIGALKGHVINQFVVESVIIALLALIVSFVLFLFLRPHFLSLEPSLQELLVLNLSPSLVLLFLVFAMVVGVSAGFFPALYFARFNAVQVLKNLSIAPVFKGITVRKTLIVFQFCVSLIAITATLIIHKQYKHFIAYDLGFTTENILNIRLQGNKAALLKKELEELPEVTGISESSIISGIGHSWGVTVKNPNNPMDSAGIFFNGIDENYLPLHHHVLLAGRNFDAHVGNSTESEVIVNQQVLKRFNIGAQQPQNALDEILKIDGKELRIIGVVKDFEYAKANSRGDKEVILRYSSEPAEYLNVKILSTDWPATYATLETIWKRLDPVHPFSAKFYDEQIEESFVGLKATMKVGGFLSMLVISIAAFGLLGMVVFTTETRLKEISIRKVMGASETGLLYLLSKGFLLLLIIAASISLPVTYLFFERILLPQIANHAPISVLEMVAGVMFVMSIALLMVGSQTLKVARSNPADVLKNE